VARWVSSCSGTLLSVSYDVVIQRDLKMSDAAPAPVDPVRSPNQMVLNFPPGTDPASLFRPNEPPKETGSHITAGLVFTWFWRSGIIGILSVGLYHVIRMKTQLDDIEPRIKSEVNAKADDIRKELTAEAKKTQEDLELLQSVIEMEHILRDLACRNQFDGMIETYQGSLPTLKKPIPESARPMIYRLVVEAAVESGKYSVFNEADLDMVDKSLRKDLVFCDSTNLERVSLLYLMDGKIDKARSTASACVAALVAQRGACRSSSCQDNAAFLYAIFMLIELCEHADQKQRVDAAWSKMRVLQVKYQVQTAQIEALYDRHDFQHAINYLALRRPDNINVAISDIRDKLKKRDFRVTPVEVRTPSGVVREDRITEVDTSNATPEPKPQPKPRPKDDGNSNDC
jgi:hypothetical protein